MWAGYQPQYIFAISLRKLSLSILYFYLLYTTIHINLHTAHNITKGSYIRFLYTLSLCLLKSWLLFSDLLLRTGFVYMWEVVFHGVETGIASFGTLVCLKVFMWLELAYIWYMVGNISKERGRRHTREYYAGGSVCSNVSSPYKQGDVFI